MALFSYNMSTFGCASDRVLRTAFAGTAVLRKDHIMVTPLIDLTDPRFSFGRWKVLYRVPNRKPPYWMCRCECGTERAVNGRALRDGLSESCGCLHLEMFIAINTSHNYSKTPIHRIWMQMIQRCLNPNNRKYHLYGGRGICVCERWFVFDNFLADAGERPSPKHSLDRYPDQNGNYEPGNVRWATSKEQTRNKRNNRNITFNGETHCLTDWAVILGVHFNTLDKRVRKWGVECAFTEPIHVAPTLTFNGQTLTRTEWCKLLGIHKNTLDKRLKRWSLEKAMTMPSQK